MNPEVGVFLSTTGIPDVQQALAAVRGLGFEKIQLGRLADSYYTPAGGAALGKLLQQADLTAISRCIVDPSESYADIEAVRRTVGLLPAETVAERVAYSKRCLDTAAELGISLVTFHVGLLPADPRDSGYDRVHRSVNQIAAHAATRGITLGLETGQETAEELLTFIDRLETPVAVNFDGANFIAYGTADPLAALKLLYPRIVGVHLKDYAPPPDPGQLSRPAPLGEGVARVGETIDYLLDAGFAEPLILETYDSQDPLATLAAARTYVHNHLQGRS
jgi:sugar phosphate isomerase/epimerase